MLQRKLATTQELVWQGEIVSDTNRRTVKLLFLGPVSPFFELDRGGLGGLTGRSTIIFHIYYHFIHLFIMSFINMFKHQIDELSEIEFDVIALALVIKHCIGLNLCEPFCWPSRLELMT